MANIKISELPSTVTLDDAANFLVENVVGGFPITQKIKKSAFVASVTWPTWPTWPTWAAGTSNFDCKVAATGGDYTTVWAALAAGKVNIYVANGSYTEDYRDCTSKNVQITWQSMLWVTIVFNKITANTSTCYINTSSSTGLQVYNMTFTLTFTGANYYFVNWNTSMDGKPFRFVWCTINYAQWDSPTNGIARKLCNIAYISLTYSSTPMGIPRSFQNGFFECYFYTNYDKISGEYALALATSWFNYFEKCRFSTDATAWTINLNWVTILKNCYLDVFRYSWGSLCLDETTISLKDWGSHADNSAWPWTTVSFYSMHNSYIKYNTSVVTSTTMNIYYASIDSQLDILWINVIFGNVWYKWVNVGNMIITTGTVAFSQCNANSNTIYASAVSTTGSQDCMFCTNKIIWAFNGDSWAFQSITWNTITWSVVLPWAGSWNQSVFCSNHVWWNLEIGRRYCAICDNWISWTVTFTSNWYENSFTGNRCGTITVTASWNYNVITGNQNGAITDWGTGTIKIWNRNN